MTGARAGGWSRSRSQVPGRAGVPGPRAALRRRPELGARPTARGWRSPPSTRVDAVALDGHGRRSARHTTFTTYVPEERFIGYVTPENRATVGTGMIVSLEFNREIEHRAAVERAVRVTSDRPSRSARTGSARTASTSAPSTYWKPGTKVTVDLRLRDVEGAPGVYGLQHKTFSFTVGRSQVSVVDAARHTMEVRRDGELLATVPITAGAPEDDHVQRQDGRQRDARRDPDERRHGRLQRRQGEYDIPDVPHAMRLTDSGTFLHGNYWATRTPSAGPTSATAAWACAT